jgi:neutral trehalase
MVIKEERCLAKMARELGRHKEEKEWLGKADSASKLVNKLMWDDASGFYYSINKTDHSFF